MTAGQSCAAGMPEFGRPVAWLGGGTATGEPAGWTAAGAPGTLHIVGYDTVLQEAVREAVGLWREAGFLPDTVTLVNGADDGGDAASIVLGAGPAVRQAWTASVVRSEDGGSGHEVVYDPALGAGVFATALWHQLTDTAGRRPTAGLAVAPLPVASDALSAGNVERRLAAPVSVAWLLLVVGLFATERTLALRGAQA
ncbi:MAG: hypothetical protein AAFY69_09370, partial [Pseudomonadota bacterium]